MTEDQDKSDPWAPIRHKANSHTIPVTPETVEAMRTGTYRLPRHAIPTNDELADALEQAHTRPIPYEMACLIASRLRAAPTLGLTGRKPKAQRLPDDARWVCTMFAMIWNANDRRRGTRETVIADAAAITGHTEASVRTILKNYWKAFRIDYPELAAPINSVENDAEN